ncbi:MAG: hypothetical protein WAJ85_14740 [Candidatus Baltobacteraceae bacterium]
MRSWLAVAALALAALPMPSLAGTVNLHQIYKPKPLGPYMSCDPPTVATIDVPVGQISIHLRERPWTSVNIAGIPMWYGFNMYEPDKKTYAGWSSNLMQAVGALGPETQRTMRAISSARTPEPPVDGQQMDYTEVDQVLQPFRVQVEIVPATFHSGDGSCHQTNMESWLTVTTAGGSGSSTGSVGTGTSANQGASNAAPDPYTGIAIPSGSSIVVQTMNSGGVFNGPTQPISFRVTRPLTITGIIDYHWNNGQGAVPGTIALRRSDGTLYGPWQASGAPGSGGVRNAFWYVQPGIVLQPGIYTIVDSGAATWSQDAQSGNRGMAEVRASGP